MSIPEIQVGVISDTHGLLRPEAVAALRGSDLIIHAGDVGDPAILAELGRIAPVHAIRGNIDVGEPLSKLPETEVVEGGDTSIYLIHNLQELDLNPCAAGFAAVVSGHSHKPASDVRDGILYFNPGSAGLRRFTLPISVGKLRIHRGRIEPAIIELQLQSRP